MTAKQSNRALRLKIAALQQLLEDAMEYNLRGYCIPPESDLFKRISYEIGRRGA